MRCVQCNSLSCPLDRCRFSGMPHAEYERVKNVLKNYGEGQIRREEDPRWLTEMRQGNPDTKPGYP
jgi:hypothetical protein